MLHKLHDINSIKLYGNRDFASSLDRVHPREEVEEDHERETFGRDVCAIMAHLLTEFLTERGGGGMERRKRMNNLERVRPAPPYVYNRGKVEGRIWPGPSGCEVYLAQGRGKVLQRRGLICRVNCASSLDKCYPLAG